MYPLTQAEHNNDDSQVSDSEIYRVEDIEAGVFVTVVVVGGCVWDVCGKGEVTDGCGGW